MLDIVYKEESRCYRRVFLAMNQGFWPIRQVSSDFLCLFGRIFMYFFELQLLIRPYLAPSEAK
jgi:hypothetical protein